MFSVLISGGPVMIPIALAAIVATVIIIERLIFYASLKKSERGLLPRIKSCIEKKHYDEAAAICNTVENPTARMIKAGIDYREYPEATVREAIMNQANREIINLERFLPTLGTIANISTLLGLLGTVTGNIKAFGVLGSSGSMGNAGQLAGAIALALVTTASGLIVAIPAVVFYNYFTAEVNRIVTGMESTASDLVLFLTTGKKAE